MAAEEKANVSYIEQLREMRAARIQQLRQGNEQKQQFSLMTRTLNSVVAATNTQTRVATQNLREQQAVVRQTREMSRDIRSLSSSITRSIGSLTSAIGRGVGGAANLAGRGVAATAGATVNLTSSIMSVLGRVLPVALVGVLGKAFIWDNLTSDTKNKLTNAIGGMFLRIFDTLKPFFAKIGDTLKSIFQDLSVELGATFAGMSAVMNKAMGDLTSSFEKSLGPLKATFKSVETLTGTANRFIDKLTPNFSVGNLSVGDVITGTGVLLAGKGAYDAVKGGGSVPSNISKAAGGRVIVITKDVKSTFDFIAKHGLPNKTESIVGARIIVEAEKAGARNFLKFVYDHKVLNVIGIIVPVGIYLWDLSHIEEILSQLERENLITPQEKEYFLSTGKYISASGLAGSALLSVLAGYAANRIGAGSKATTVSSFLGAGAGTKMGEYVGKPLHQVAEFFGVAPKRPESLDREVISGTSTVERLLDLQRQRTGGTPQASEVVPNGQTGSDGVNMDLYRNLVGITEGGSAAYDAMFGQGSEAGVQQYMRNETGGKRLTEMTIGEAIALQKKRTGNTHAMGRYQFTDLETAARLAGLKMSDKMSPENQDKMFAAYTNENRKALIDLGIEPTPFTLRLAHAVGPVGAKKLLDANKTNPGALPADVLGFPLLDKQGNIHPFRLTNPQLAGLGKYKGQTVSSYLNNMNQMVTATMGGQSNLPMGNFGGSTGQDIQSVYMQAYNAYKEQHKKRDEGDAGEKASMKFFNSAAVEGLLGAFKDGSELKSNIVSDLRNMTSVLSAPSEEKTEPVKNIVTNFNTTNVNNVNGGGGGGTASVNSVRPNNDLVTDFLKMSGT